MADVQLYLGDCLDILPTLETGSVDAVITDPPYGVDYQSAWRIDKDARLPKIQNDKRPFIWWLYHAYRVTRDKGALACFCTWETQEIFRMATQAAGYTIKSHVIWDRDWHGLGDLDGHFAPQHDVIWFATKGGFKFQNGRPKSVIRISRLPAEHLEHPNEKPVPLLEYIVRHVSGFFSTILDPVMGVGPTGQACVKTGRNFIGIEIDPDYYAIAEKRIAEAQMQPRLEGI